MTNLLGETKSYTWLDLQIYHFDRILNSIYPLGNLNDFPQIDR